ncbi:MAG: hypothetical protein IPN33_23075 [Saprospiraceae bacterium]|nr:hypothetical protein [Saprospiraceae bacterium]
MADIYRIFDSAGYRAAYEELGISQEEGRFITETNPRINSAWINRNWEYPFKLTNFLQKSGLTRDEVHDLLAVRYIVLDANPEIKPLTEGEITITEEKITYIDNGILSRMHRFYRLAHNLGWQISELDAVLKIAANKPDGLYSLDKNALHALAKIKRIKEKLNTDLEKATAICFELTDQPFGAGKKGLLSGLFGSYVDKIPFTLFTDAFGEILTEDSLDSPDRKTQHETINALLGALSLSLTDFQLFIAYVFESIQKLETEAGFRLIIDQNIISTFFRYSELSRFLQIPVEQLIWIVGTLDDMYGQGIYVPHGGLGMELGQILSCFRVLNLKTIRSLIAIKMEVFGHCPSSLKYNGCKLLSLQKG